MFFQTASGQSKDLIVFWSEKAECGRKSESVTVNISCGHAVKNNSSTRIVKTDSFELRLMVGAQSPYLIANIELTNHSDKDIAISMSNWNIAQFRSEADFLSGKAGISRTSAFQSPRYERIGRAREFSTVQSSKPELPLGVIKVEERMTKFPWLFQDPLTATSVKSGKTAQGNIAFTLERQARYRLLFIAIEGITYVFYSMPIVASQSEKTD